MGKINESYSKLLVNLPESHLAWANEHIKGRFNFLGEYLRYLLRQDILRHGPLPTPIPKVERREERETHSTPPA